jgi:serine protease Do
LALLVGLTAEAAAKPPKVPRSSAARPSSPTVNAPAPLCQGDYSDDLNLLAQRVREFDRQPYSYCVRNTAVYECVSYATDGNLRHTKKRAILHGTAFGYKNDTQGTLLVTNQHVAEWPAVTDEEHTVDGVPAGCKKVSETLRVVDNESDAYEADDIQLSRLVADAQLDVAVLRSHTQMHILPWKLGSAKALRERNVVEVRGFPLGAFQATSVGKVISAWDHDSQREWEHDDFVVDALLSAGNSGSPVLAISCKTGEFELVGIYHAGYADGSALNVVVGIDQVRPLITTLKRAPRQPDAPPLDPRDRLQLSTAPGSNDAWFPFGNLTATVTRRVDGALVWELYSREFPLRVHPIALVEDLPPVRGGDDTFGTLGRVWLGGSNGLRVFSRGALDAEAQSLIGRALDGFRRDASAIRRWRAAGKNAHTRDRFEQAARLERTLRRSATARKDLVNAVVDLAERLGPKPGEVGLSSNDAMIVVPPTAANEE